MTTEQLNLIESLRRLNYPYSFIARELNISMNTIKSICRRNGYIAIGRRKTKAEKLQAPICKCCHKPLPKGMRSDAQFCSAYCRKKWHREQLKTIQKNT